MLARGTCLLILLAVSSHARAVPDDADPRCADPCRFLAEVSLDDARQVISKTCGLSWEQPRAADLAAVAYTKSCIYAETGQPFAHDVWRHVFTGKAWYEPKRGWSRKDLSAVAKANIGKLQALEPKQPPRFWASELTAADERAVVAWASRQRRASDSDRDIGRETWGDRVLMPWTPMTYGERHEDGGRVVWIDIDAPGPTCSWDEVACDGMMYIELTLDRRGRIVAVSHDESACPAVYIEAGGIEVLQGEILRDLVGAEQETTQHLTLPHVERCEPLVRVRLREEKDEVTWLDHVALTVGGVRVAPVACASAEPPRYCGAADGQYESIVRGESLVLEFMRPTGFECLPVELEARGFYVPVPRSPPRVGPACRECIGAEVP